MRKEFRHEPELRWAEEPSNDSKQPLQECKDNLDEYLEVMLW